MNTHLPLAAALALSLLATGGRPLAAQPPGPPAARGLFDWGLKLPERAVPRRVEQGGLRVPVGKPQVLANLVGPGCVRHLWFTGVFPGRQYVLRIYFDGAATPHVEAPL